MDLNKAYVGLCLDDDMLPDGFSLQLDMLSLEFDSPKSGFGLEQGTVVCLSMSFGGVGGVPSFAFVSLSMLLGLDLARAS